MIQELNFSTPYIILIASGKKRGGLGMTLEHLRTYFWCFKGVLTFFCCVVHTCKNLCNTSYLQCDDDSADDADESTDECR